MKRQPRDGGRLGRARDRATREVDLGRGAGRRGGRAGDHPGAPARQRAAVCLPFFHALNKLTVPQMRDRAPHRERDVRDAHGHGYARGGESAWGRVWQGDAGRVGREVNALRSQCRLPIVQSNS
jgi:hypothetical protein